MLLQLTFEQFYASLKLHVKSDRVSFTHMPPCQNSFVNIYNYYLWEFCFWQQFILEYMLSGTKEKQNFFHIWKGVTGEYRVSMEIRNKSFWPWTVYFLFIKEIGTKLIQFWCWYSKLKLDIKRYYQMQINSKIVKQLSS